MGVREEEAVLRVMRSGWLTTGREAAAFEEEFSALTRYSHSLAVNSATAGLHLALEGLGINPGDAVAVPSYTFAASAEVIRYLGADPVFVEIDPTTLTMDPDALECAIERDSRIAAAIPVHIGGYPCDMGRILPVCRRRNIAVVEDAAHFCPGLPLPDTDKNLRGAARGYSFYATKTITTGEGGMIATDRDDLAARATVMRLHGIDRPVWNRYTKISSRSWEYRIVDAGYKYNMSDLCAAIGRIQLERAAEFQAARKRIAGRYLEAFSRIRSLTVPADHPDHSWHLFILRLSCADPALLRDRMVDFLAGEGIGTSVHYIPLHLMPYYASRYGIAPEDFPVSMDAYTRCLSLPIYPAMNDGDIERVISAVIDGTARILGQ
jgi:dTDP-4-amino-4,6-dideoxygalactose transaminase